MGSLQDTKGFAAVKRQVAAFSVKAEAPAAPTSRAAELRYDGCSIAVSEDFRATGITLDF